MYLREQTRKVLAGGLPIGGGSPVVIQSMTNTKTQDVAATVRQIRELEEAGCELVRVAIPNLEAAEAVREIKRQIRLPLVADIHFDYRLAVTCIKNGVDKIRLNPGNIGGEDKVRTVVELAKEHRIPIRVGVNGGSLEKELLKKYGTPCPKALVESALGHVRLLQKFEFEDIVVSLKTSSVKDTITAYRLFAEESDLPLHLGVTEAGSRFAGSIKSAVGIGSLLSQGIGDTLRVSLTGSPVQEIEVAKEILKALELRDKGVEIISCPTCGRCQVQLEKIAEEITQKTSAFKKNITIAVMGCAVNGPGEAREADIGVACGKEEGLLFIKGKILRKVGEAEIVPALLQLMESYKEDEQNAGL